MAVLPAAERRAGGAVQNPFQAPSVFGVLARQGRCVAVVAVKVAARSGTERRKPRALPCPPARRTRYRRSVLSILPLPTSPPMVRFARRLREARRAERLKEGGLIDGFRGRRVGVRSRSRCPASRWCPSRSLRRRGRMDAAEPVPFNPEEKIAALEPSGSSRPSARSMRSSRSSRSTPRRRGCSRRRSSSTQSNSG